jgi:Plavaka transposase
MGNPIIKDSLQYAPQKHFTDEEGTNRVFDEMWTGDWWWNTQVKLPSTCNHDSEHELMRDYIKEKFTNWFNHCPPYSII